MRGFAWAAAAVLLLAFAPGAALAAKPDKPAKVKPEKPEKTEQAGKPEVPGTGHGHGRHADDVIPVTDGTCDRAQPGPVPEPEEPIVPPKEDPDPKEDPKPNPDSPGGDEFRLSVSQPEVLAAEAGPAVRGELPFTGLPLALLAPLGATAAVAGGLLRRNQRSSVRTTRLESR